MNEMETGISYWLCDRCGSYVKQDEYHVCCHTCPPLGSWTGSNADYILRVLERIEQSLLRIEKLLEKEL